MIGQQIAVLDKGFVELIDMMPHPKTGISADQAVVNAARVSYLGESKGEEADKGLLFYLMRHHHSSPFEQVQFKFRVKAPLMTYWQWVRHRTFSFQSINSQSGRYTKFEEDEFYAPACWRRQSLSNKQGSEGEIRDLDQDALDGLLSSHYVHCMNLYNYALEAGVSRELARVFLPGFSVYYTWIVSVNAWNLMHFLKLRLADDAQFEIRVYAQALYRFFQETMPWTAEAYAQSF